MGQQVDVHLKFRGIDRDYVVQRGAGGPAAGRLRAGGAVAGGADAFRSKRARTSRRSEGEEYDEGDAGWTCQVCVGRPKATLQYADMREDRVVFYVDAGKDMSEIVYRIKATNVGNYVVPPAYGEAMYDRSVVGRSAAGKLEVSRP